jgi:acetyltransferase-like isoleucine patch superfamily enzyme
MENIGSIGKFTYGCPNIKKWNTTSKLFIGNFCSIAGSVVYLDGNHNTKRVTTYPFGHIHRETFNTVDGSGHPLGNGHVVIGNDVWIADNVTIMSGIIIGNGAVVANNSHVIKNVEPYSIVGGNPARHIKYRFSEEQIKNLLEIQWWYWDDEKINKYLPLMCSEDIDNFINAASNNLL